MNSRETVNLSSGQRPPSLRGSDFSGYSPAARNLAISSLELLGRLPLILVVVLLKQIQRFDLLFPAEQVDLRWQLDQLGKLDAYALSRRTGAFDRIDVSAGLVASSWVTDPASFLEALTAELWSSGQIGIFRGAAAEVIFPLEEAAQTKSRLVMILIPRELDFPERDLFEKLKSSGTVLHGLRPKASDASALEQMYDVLVERASKLPDPSGHWYVDGGNSPFKANQGVSSLAYQELDTARKSLIQLMDRIAHDGASGPEGLRSRMFRLKPEEIGLELGRGPLTDQFALDILAEGSGSQIFSTTFVQWTARELLRRAQPSTMLIRFQPRNAQPVGSKWSDAFGSAAVDLRGSFIDAAEGSFYTYLNLQRLRGAAGHTFFIWHEASDDAFAAGPAFPAGTSSKTETSIRTLLDAAS